MNTTINLMNFGMEVLQYKNDKSVARYFISKFNEKFNFPENNCTGTVAEIIVFANTSAKKELKEWSNEKMQEILSVGLGQDIARETFVIESTPARTRTPRATTPPATSASATTVSSTQDLIADDQILDIINGL